MICIYDCFGGPAHDLFITIVAHLLRYLQSWLSSNSSTQYRVKITSSSAITAHSCVQYWQTSKHGIWYTNTPYSQASTGITPVCYSTSSQS
jgi:hypothetical protein